MSLLQLLISVVEKQPRTIQKWRDSQSFIYKQATGWIWSVSISLPIPNLIPLLDTFSFKLLPHFLLPFKSKALWKGYLYLSLLFILSKILSTLNRWHFKCFRIQKVVTISAMSICVCSTTILVYMEEELLIQKWYVINYNKYCQIDLHRNVSLYFSTPVFRWFDICQFEMWKIESHNFNLLWIFLLGTVHSYPGPFSVWLLTFYFDLWKLFLD